MSFELDHEGKKQDELKKELNAIDYHSFKKELDSRGVGSIWKAGMKKVDLVKKAFAKLTFIESAKIELGEDAGEEAINKKVFELEQAEITKSTKAKIERTKLKSAGAQNIYNILLKRHLKDDVLDIDAVKASLKEWEFGKLSTKLNASLRVIAHKQVLKDFI